MKATDLINKEVISLKTATVMGKCVNVACSADLTLVTHLIVAETKEGDSTLSSLPFDVLFSEKGDALTVSTDCTAPVPSAVLSPLGLRVFSTKGKTEGKIDDVVFTQKGIVRSILSEGKALSTKKILCAKDVLLLKGATPHNALLPKVHSTLKIRKQSGDFSFLLGRVCDKNITNFFGETVIKHNSVVTKETLKTARVNGKLLELSLHCH